MRLSKLFLLLTFAPCALFASTLTFSTRSSSCTDNCQVTPAYSHADLNNDGREDLVYIYDPNYFLSTFAVRLSNGDGTYAPATLYTLPPNPNPNDTYLSSIVIGDFNNDGYADVGVFGVSGTTNQAILFIYRNEGNGTLTLDDSYPLPVAAVSAAVGDFNHDGYMDIVYNEQYHPANLDVFFGTKAGVFNDGPKSVLPSDPMGSFLVGDFDGDGIADLAYQDVNGAEVVYGNNTGTFASNYQVVPHMNYFNLTAEDVNGNGTMDLVFSQVNPFSKSVAVYYGDSGRQFNNHTTIPFSHCVVSVIGAADMDGNGINDLIATEAPSCTPGVGGPQARMVGILTRNSDSSYNPDQIVYNSPVNYDIPTAGQASPFVLRANPDTRPDLLIQQCTGSECDGYTEYNLLNTTIGNFPTCPAPNAYEGINVCSPGGEASSPVPFAIGAAGQVPMRKVEVWVDGTKEDEQLDGFSNYSFLNHSISLSPGSHKVDVYAAGWDNSLVEKSFTLNVH
jgi:hypothetical protein